MERKHDLSLSEELQSVLRQLDRLMETMAVFRQLFEAQAVSEGVHSVGISETLREVMEDLQPLAELQRVTMAFDRCGSALKVNMSKGTLRQLLWNLLQNCIEVSREGTVRVTGDGAWLTVSDTCRPAAGELENIFDPFSFCGLKKDSIGVSNLPLAVMQRVMLVAGGEVSVTGTEQGRRFDLRFPVGIPLAG